MFRRDLHRPPVRCEQGHRLDVETVETLACECGQHQAFVCRCGEVTLAGPPEMCVT